MSCLDHFFFIKGDDTGAKSQSKYLVIIIDDSRPNTERKINKTIPCTFLGSGHLYNVIEAQYTQNECLILIVFGYDSSRLHLSYVGARL